MRVVAAIPVNIYNSNVCCMPVEAESLRGFGLLYNPGFDLANQ